MTVSEILAGDTVYEVSGSGYGPLGDIKTVSELGPALADNIAARECLLAGLLCNDSALAEKSGRWEVQGDPTEGALIASAAKGGLDHKEWSARLRRIDAIPFESQHQYMASLHASGAMTERKMYVKGAAEAVLSKSVTMLDGSGHRVPLDAVAVQHQLERLALKGLRVLVLASADLPGDTQSINHADVNELTFLGLQGMIDPPRPEAISAVRACQSAGIHVKMITGDHALTAQAIARQIGLNGRDTARPDGPLVLTGRELTRAIRCPTDRHRGSGDRVRARHARTETAIGPRAPGGGPHRGDDW